jgi:Uma2 family endonuclease
VHVTLPVMRYVPEAVRPLRRVEYEKLVELGMFDEDERIELIRGFLVPMSPIGPPHSSTIDRLNKILVFAIGDNGIVRVQNPIAATDDSEPEPDFTVVANGDYTKEHPERALLLVEVADSSLAFDRGVKLGIYAECYVPEYWIVNVKARRVEVYRGPDGTTYTSLRHYHPGETITLVQFPDVTIRVDDIVK